MKQVQAVIDKLSLILYPNIDQFEEDPCKHLNSDRLAMVSAKVWVKFWISACVPRSYFIREKKNVLKIMAQLQKLVK